MTSERTVRAREDIPTGGQADLDRHYGNIGISAIAAALPYRGDAKNPAYAPVEPREDNRFDPAA